MKIGYTNIILRKDNSATIVITSGYGSYTVSSDDTNIADAALVGSTVIIIGKSGGTTVLKVIDTISGNMEEFSVRVKDALTCPDENHPHLIDLGLPSGTKWACCNVGADKPEAYGGYFAWGETEEKDVYNESTYKYYRNGYLTNDLDISGTEYDVAHVKWGGKWSMPIFDEQRELRENCTAQWMTLNGVNGTKFTSNINDNSIFLPAANRRSYEGFDGAGGFYWSSSEWWGYRNAYSLTFSQYGVDWNFYDRQFGQNVRPVVRN